MGTEGVYIKKEYTEKIKKMVRILKIEDSKIRQSCLELGVDIMLELCQYG